MERNSSTWCTKKEHNYNYYHSIKHFRLWFSRMRINKWNKCISRVEMKFLTYIHYCDYSNLKLIISYFSAAWWKAIFCSMCRSQTFSGKVLWLLIRRICTTKQEIFKFVFTHFCILTLRKHPLLLHSSLTQTVMSQFMQWFQSIHLFLIQLWQNTQE